MRSDSSSPVSPSSMTLSGSPASLACVLISVKLSLCASSIFRWIVSPDITISILWNTYLDRVETRRRQSWIAWRPPVATSTNGIHSYLNVGHFKSIYFKFDNMHVDMPPFIWIIVFRKVLEPIIQQGAFNPLFDRTLFNPHNLGAQISPHIHVYNIRHHAFLIEFLGIRIHVCIWLTGLLTEFLYNHAKV